MTTVADFANTILSNPFYLKSEVEALRMQECKYPKFNTFIKEDATYIEIALAGYKKKDIKISVEYNVVIVKGEFTRSYEGTETILKGISSKSFEQRFPIKPNFHIEQATMEDGLLVIKLVKDPSKITEITIQ
jgi:molecular chaperone IbpA